MKGAWKCALTGRHKWSEDIEAIPASSLFHRVDCVRCGHSIDGAALKAFIQRESTPPWLKRRLT